MPFQKLFGQPLAVNFLKAALKARKIPHAMIFYGPDGVGKKLCAFTLAHSLLYPEKSSEIDQKRVLSGAHPDLLISKPEGKTALHPIALLRKMIHEAELAPFEAKAKVFVIEEAHRMLAASANILLKILEEPLDDRYFILLTSELESILPTIGSRCVKVQFHPIDENEIMRALIDQHQTSEKIAMELSKFALGSLGDAISLLKDANYEKKLFTLVNLIEKVLKKDFLAWSDLLDEMQNFYDSKDDDSKVLDDEKILQNKKNITLLFQQVGLIFRDIKLAMDPEFPQNFLNFQSYFSHVKEKELFEFLPSIEIINQYLKDAKQGYDLNIPLKACLEAFFLRLYGF